MAWRLEAVYCDERHCKETSGDSNRILSENGILRTLSRDFMCSLVWLKMHLGVPDDDHTSLPNHYLGDLPELVSCMHYPYVAIHTKLAADSILACMRVTSYRVTPQALIIKYACIRSECLNLLS